MSLAPRTPRLPTQRPSDSLLDERAGSEYSTHGSFADPRPAPAGCGGTSSGGAAAATDPSAGAFCGPDGHVSALALGAAAPAEARATVRRHTAELAWDEWGGRRRLSLRSSARRDARRERGACLPRDSSWGRAQAGLTCAGRSTARGRPTLAWGAPSTCSASSALPPSPPPARTVSALEGPIIRRRHPPALQCPQAPPTPAAAQRSPQPTPQPTARSPRRSLPGPVRCAASRDGVPLLLPPAHLRTCLPPAHQCAVAAADVNAAAHAGF